MRPRSSIQVGIPLLLGLALVCVPELAFGQGVIVGGRVRTEDGKTLHVGITVRVEGVNRQTVQELYAGSDGEFEFRPLPPVEFWLVVSADGYQTSRTSLDLRWEGGKKFITIRLAPEAKHPRPADEAAALTDHAVPRKARNEHKKGRRALESADYAEAQSHFEKAVAAYPCYARAQTDLAMALAGQGLAEPAETALRKSLECDADYHPAYALLGMILNSHQRYGEGEKVLLEGLRRAPGLWRLHYQMGISCYGQDQDAKAEEHFLKALSLDPELPEDIHARLADVYLKRRSYGEAYAQLEAYLRVAPAGRFAANVRQRMEQIRTSGVLFRNGTKAADPRESEPADEPGLTLQE